MDGLLGLADFIYRRPRPDDLREALLQSILQARGETAPVVALRISDQLNATPALDSFIALSIIQESFRWMMLRDRTTEQRFVIDLFLQGLRTTIANAGIETEQSVKEREAEVGREALHAEAQASMEKLRQAFRDRDQ